MSSLLRRSYIIRLTKIRTLSIDLPDSRLSDQSKAFTKLESLKRLPS